MSTMRICGLVSLMNAVREQLAIGLVPSEVGEFRDHISKAIADVESVCRDEGIRPSDLPGPSFRAYRFLKDLDLSDLPLREEGGSGPTRPLRISNVVSSANRYQEVISSIAEASVGLAEDRWRQAALANLRADIAETVQLIEDIATKNGHSPSALPTRSRRAYQWLRFLSVEDNLRCHVDTVSELIRIDIETIDSAARPAAMRCVFANVTLYHVAHLYRARATLDGLEISANECFVGAPRRVLEALIEAATDVERKANVARLREYARSDAFVAVMRELEEATADSDAGGVYHDLVEAFDRVNATCFGGRLECPKLGWTRTHTVRKLGHYDPTADRIVVSTSLDSERVPTYVVDFVVYHELLHRELDEEPGGSRRTLHGRRFRAAERRFPEYVAARRFLAKLDPKLRLDDGSA